MVNPFMFLYYWTGVLLHPRAYRRHQAYVREQNKYLDGLPYDDAVYRVQYLDGR